MNATVLPESLVQALTTAPAWKVQKDYAGVLFLLIELPSERDALLTPLWELSDVAGEPLVVPSDLINTLEMAKLDPKEFDPKSFVDVEGDCCIIPPNSFALAETVEYLEIPRDILCVCVGKSTYARCGIIVNVTPLEPEWRGRITIEISNTTPLPAKIYSGEGIAQILFLRAEENCRVSYADKKGKYQDQPGLTLPVVHGSGAGAKHG